MNEYKKYNKILIDVYNVCWQWSSKKSENTSNVHTEIIEGFFNAFESYKKRFADEHTQFYFLMDNASTLWERKKISPQYKQNRKKITPPNWFFRSIDLIESITSCYEDNIIYYRVPQWEADDYVPSLISTFENGTSVLMISTDMDWCRCLSDSNIVVEQYTGNAVNKSLSNDNGIITVESFQRKYKFKPTYKSICFYKSFYGDDSDCIKPIISELPSIYFKKIISECKNMEDFIEKIENKEISFDVGWSLRIKKDKDLLLDNWKLVTSPFLTKEVLAEYKHISKYNASQLKLIYANLNLTFDKRFTYSVKTSIYDMLDGTTLERDVPKSILDKSKDKFDKPNSRMGTKKDNGLRKNIFNDL